MTSDESDALYEEGLEGGRESVVMRTEVEVRGEKDDEGRTVRREGWRIQGRLLKSGFTKPRVTEPFLITQPRHD